MVTWIFQGTILSLAKSEGHLRSLSLSEKALWVCVLGSSYLQSSPSGEEIARPTFAGPPFPVRKFPPQDSPCKINPPFFHRQRHDVCLSRPHISTCPLPFLEKLIASLLDHVFLVLLKWLEIQFSVIKTRELILIYFLDRKPFK